MAFLLMSSTGCGNDRPQKESSGGGGIKVEGTEGGGGQTDVRTSSTGTSTGTEEELELPPDGTDGQNTFTEEACESTQVDLQQPPTKLMLVLDKSGSMVFNTWDHDGDGGALTPPVTRWYSLHEVVDQVTTKFNSSISFGAQLYPAKSAHGGNVSACEMAGEPEVPISKASRDAIMAMLPPKTADKTVVLGATPTYSAYTSSLTHLLAAQANTPEQEKKDAQPPAIVLVTDGGANCGNLDDADCLSQVDASRPTSACIDKWFNSYDDRIHAAVSGALSDHAIKTYIIGIGIKDELGGSPSVNAHEKLNQLAQEGGTARPGTSAYFSADNQKLLLEALDEIAASVRSCTVKMDTPVPEDRRDYVKLAFPKGEVPKLGPNVDSCVGQEGWRWDHSEKEYGAIELCGAYCEELKTLASVDVEVGCAPPV